MKSRPANNQPTYGVFLVELMRTPKQKDSTPNGLIPIDLTLASLSPQQIKALLRLLLVEVDVERKLHRGEVEDANSISLVGTVEAHTERCELSVAGVYLRFF